MAINKKELAKYITTSIVFDKTVLDIGGLSPSIWEKYLHLGVKRIRKKGECIFGLGENINGVYFIKKGTLQGNFLGKDGTIKTFSIVGEGCVYGEQFVFHEQPGLFETMVVEDAELYFFRKDLILEIMKKDFEINLFLIKSLAIKSRRLAAQLEDMTLRNAIQCIARILYSLACYEEKNEKENKETSIHISHQDLANMLACHRVTVTKNLAKLKELGILDYGYEKIIIKDKAKLKIIAHE